MPTAEQRFARPRVAAGVLFRDDQGRVLLVKPSYKSGWDLPGGYVEHGESPRAAAAREVLEELGVAWPVGALLVVDWAPHPDEGDKLLFIFDGGTITGSQLDHIRAAPDEIADVQAHTVETLADLMPTRLARRVAEAASGRSGQYLEHGELS